MGYLFCLYKTLDQKCAPKTYKQSLEKYLVFF